MLHTGPLIIDLAVPLVLRQRRTPMKRLIAALILFTTPVHAAEKTYVWWTTPSSDAFYLEIGKGRIIMRDHTEGGGPGDINCRTVSHKGNWSNLKCSDGQMRTY